MERKEMVDLFNTIGDLFPHFKYNQLQDAEQKKRMLRNWYEYLGDFDLKEVERRLKKYVKKANVHPPTVGDLVPKDERTGPAIPSYEETKQRLAYYDEMNQTAKKRTEEEEAHVQRYKAHIERTLQLARERQGG